MTRGHKSANHFFQIHQQLQSHMNSYLVVHKWQCSSRAVSAAFHTPQLGGTLSQGARNSELSPLTQFQSPKFKYETLQISEVFANPYSVLCPVG